jgi:hypothetical protein
VTDLLGVSIHDPDVVFTDLGLTILAAYLGRRLWTMPGRGTLPGAGAVLLGGLASAALWGAIFHAFFPGDTATFAGFVSWIPVVLSILVVAAAMLELALRILLPRLPPRVRRAIVGTYAASFFAVVLLVDESFTSIVRFYVPALLLLLIAAGQQAIRTRSAGWTLIATGLTTSVGAALLQQAEVSIHRVYFDHNAVYHVVQGIALVVLYLGFRRVPEAPASTSAPGSSSSGFDWSRRQR